MNFREDQKRYKVSWEDGYKGGDEPWLYMEIRGRRGMIYPYSKTHIVLLVKSRVIGERIKRSGKFRILRDTDDGMEFIAKNENFMHFCSVIRAFKKYFEKTIFLMKKNGFTGDYLKALNEVEKELTGK